MCRPEDFPPYDLPESDPRLFDTIEGQPPYEHDVPIADGGVGAGRTVIDTTINRVRGISRRDYKIMRYCLLFTVIVGDIAAWNLSAASFELRALLFAAFSFLYVASDMLTRIAERQFPNDLHRPRQPRPPRRARGGGQRCAGPTAR